ncbi:MAG: acyl-CoA thioesterase domain-containing protein [Pseudomonadota bacterium]
MPTLFDKLIQRLTLRKAPDADSDAVFIGGSGSGGVTANARLFGGLVAAQATVAAVNAVNAVNANSHSGNTSTKDSAPQPAMPLHSLHSYFLRPGRADSDIEYRVQNAKDGRNFKVRNVQAWQQGQLIFQLQASFQRPEDESFSHAPSMPTVKPPAEAPNRDQLRGRENWREMPIDVRMLNEITTDQAAPAEQAVWIKANGDVTSAAYLHYGLLVYASDRSLLDTAWRPHADQGELVGASLDHSIWFHELPDMNQWLLYDMYSPVASASRGLAFGHMFSETGNCIATVAQEGLLRVKR